MSLPLHCKDGISAFAIIDEGDADLARYRWFLNKRGYAVRNLLSGESGFPGMVLLHRVILGLVKGDGIQVDHKNRDRLDNRKTNLRIASNALNRQNMGPRQGTRFRGVRWSETRNRWVINAQVNGKRVYLGRYRTEEEAARVAAEWRREHMPFSEEAAS